MKAVIPMSEINLVEKIENDKNRALSNAIFLTTRSKVCLDILM